jgi:hypothetical protein
MYLCRREGVVSIYEALQDTACYAVSRTILYSLAIG